MDHLDGAVYCDKKTGKVAYVMRKKTSPQIGELKGNSSPSENMYFLIGFKWDLA